MKNLSHLFVSKKPKWDSDDLWPTPNHTSVVFINQWQLRNADSKALIEFPDTDIYLFGERKPETKYGEGSYSIEFRIVSKC